MIRVYKSRIDPWLLMVLLAAMGVSALAALEVILVAERGAWWIAAVAAGLGIGLPAWLMLGTNYRLDDKELRISCGPFRWRILLAAIHSVEPSSNPIASPALSLKRLRIDYGRGQAVFISPPDRRRFLEELERLAGKAYRPD